jgi:hypothetical protein
MSDTPWFDGFNRAVKSLNLPDPGAFTNDLLNLCERHNIPAHMAALYCAAAIGVVIGARPCSDKERRDAVEKSVAILRDAITACAALARKRSH